MYSSADICSTSTLDKEDGSAVMTMNKYRLGIDIGSTTVKIAILDDDNNILDISPIFRKLYRDFLKRLYPSLVNSRSTL